MKPILRDRRREAMSRTRTPGPGPAPGPTGPEGATSLLELGREGQDGAEVERLQSSSPPQEEFATLWPPREEEEMGGDSGKPEGLGH